MGVRDGTAVYYLAGIFCSALLMGCGSDSTAPASVLAVAPVLHSGGGAVVSDKMIFLLTISDGGGEDTVFADTVRNGDRGRDLVASGPGFQRARTLLTDDVNETVTRGMFFPTGGGGGSFNLESVYFAGRPGTALDFSGYQVTGIVFHVDSILLATPGSNINGDGIWTDWYLRGSLVVLGHPN